MHRFSLYAILTLLCLLLPARHAGAQRTAEGTAFAGFAPHVSVRTAPSWGFGLEAGRYTAGGLWKIGVRAVDWNQRACVVPDGTAALFDSALLSAGFVRLVRLWGSYGRRASVYAGGGVFLGACVRGALRPLPPETAGDFPAAEFAYGVEPVLELELFPFRTVAAVLSVQSPFTFGASLPSDFWRVCASLGIRVNI